MSTNKIIADGLRKFLIYVKFHDFLNQIYITQNLMIKAIPKPKKPKSNKSIIKFDFLNFNSCRQKMIQSIA